MARQRIIIEFVDDKREVIATHVLEDEWFTFPVAHIEDYVMKIMREFPNVVTFNFKGWMKF